MRFFEIILLIIASVLPFYSSTKNYAASKKVVLGFIGGILILHFILEGYRWQMIPAYIVILILIWCIYKDYKFFVGGWFRKIASAIGLALLLVIGWSIPIITPIFKLPKPTGEYPIGSQYIHVKTERDEIITTDPDDKREFMVKIWYPSKTTNKKSEKYLTSADRMGFAIKYGVPKSIFNYLDYVKTHTYENAEIADGTFPVLIFSHGYQSQANGYYSILEEIVSHGYIVINMNHTYESTGALFPNGEIKYFDKEYQRIRVNDKMNKMAMDAYDGYFTASNWDEQHKAVEYALRNYQAGFVTKLWAEDITSVIDKLSDWNTSTFLKNHMNISKLGVFGHSQGGSAAGQTLLEDKRVKAAINIDGLQWGNMVDTIMTKPLALLVSDWPNTHPNFNQHIHHNGSTTDFFNAMILETGHSSFMDIPIMINNRFISLAGNIEPDKASKITSEFVLQFFDKYLLHQQIDILNLAKKYPELEIELHEKSNTKNFKKELSTE